MDDPRSDERGLVPEGVPDGQVAIVQKIQFLDSVLVKDEVNNSHEESVK